MSLPSHYFNPYDRLAPFYDWMARSMLAPFGGERAFRREAIATLDIEPGMRVLELGCGTGSMTAELLRLGARVTALDLSEPMLERARRRAEDATYLRMDILAYETTTPFDRVLLAFVLHEMEAETRARALTVAAAALSPDGLLGVLDFSSPSEPWLRWILETHLRLSEPETAMDLLRRGLEAEVRESGLLPVRQHALARGTAAVVVARGAGGYHSASIR